MKTDNKIPFIITGILFIVITVLVSKKEPERHCQLKTETVSYLKTNSAEQTKLIREQLQYTSQKLDNAILLLE